MNRNIILFLYSILGILTPQLQGAEQRLHLVEIHFREHRFEPAVVIAPAGVQLELRVINDGPKAIEFEIFKLHVEQVVGPGRSALIKVPVPKPGIYAYVDDFDESVKEGEIRVQ